MANVINNYSAAIFQIAQKHNLLDEVKIQMESIFSLCLESKINRFLCSNAIDYLSKQKIISMLQNKLYLNSIVMKFLQITVKNNKFSFWKEIYSSFLKHFNSFSNIMIVNVTSAKELNEDEKNGIIKSLNDKYQKKIQANFVVDNEIVAGLVFNLIEANEILDLSLKNYLDNIELRLKNYSYV
jgi:F-type H+-transporting ATPase subunit delta